MNNCHKNFERVLKFIESVPEEHFYMGRVLRLSSVATAVCTNHNDDVKYKLKHWCGTSACVYGYMPCIFPETFEYYKNKTASSLWLQDIKSFDNIDAYTKVCSMLGIDDEDFDALFGATTLSDIGISDKECCYIDACARNKSEQIEAMKLFKDSHYN